MGLFHMKQSDDPFTSRSCETDAIAGCEFATVPAIVSVSLASAGYRPFFLVAALNAVASMTLWLVMLAGVDVPTQGWPPSLLHAHEILYGTVAPVIAGFLLTAVPNWSASRKLEGVPLLGLVAAWGAGRIAMILSGRLDPISVAIIDVAFLPLLGLVIGIPIIASRKVRNFPVLAVVLALALANAAIHGGLIAHDAAMLRAGTTGAVYLVVVLLIIMTGRLVPLFTRNKLKHQGVEVGESPVWLDVAGVALTVSIFGIDLVRPGNQHAALVALAVAVLLAVRQSYWSPLRTRHEPMLWVLHVGHGWLIVGFILHAGANWFGGFLGAAALHCFTAGAMGTLMLGMMTRVSLGHGGHAIEADGWTKSLFVLVIVGAVLRVAGALSTQAMSLYLPGLLVGGALWTTAWLIFCVRYWKPLTGHGAEAG